MKASHKLACFIRIDLAVAGTPSESLYDDIAERLQDLIQEALLAKPRRYELEGMTCRIAGPLEHADGLANGEIGQEFEPLIAILNQDAEGDG